MEFLGALIVGLLIGGLAVRQTMTSAGGRTTPGQADRGHVNAESAPAADPDARLVSALSALPLGLVVTDRDGTIVFRNDVAAEFDSGRHTDAIVAAALDEVISAARNGVQVERELDLYGPPRRFLVVRGAPIFHSSSTNGAILIIEDVTEIQRMRNVRRDFVANVSHELKTPVGAIGVLAETLADETDPEVADRLARRLQSESFRLGSTIDDLLELSQIEAGETTEHVPVSMQSVVAAAIERLSSGAELRNIELSVDQPEHDAIVLGDRRQLQSALSNLLDNAIKYSDESTVIKLVITVDERLVGVTVTDNGIGIPEGDLDRVFERFYRVDPARSRSTGGTGLGLSIVNHVVRNHEGEIVVTSREGEGSTFALTFRRAPVEAQTPESTSPADGAINREVAETTGAADRTKVGGN